MRHRIKTGKIGSFTPEKLKLEKEHEVTVITQNVDAPVYNMMGQRVDKSQKGLVIYKGKKYVNK